MRRLTTEQFIERARAVHGDKYDYSKVDYNGNRVKVTIICPEHGEFEQTPTAHLSGQGCKFCSHRNLNGNMFIEKAKAIHGDKYDYSKVEYINNRTKVCIICPEHGEFMQQPGKHLLGQGCPICANQYSPTTEEWIERAKKVHGDKYDYSKAKYVNTVTPITIICRRHGEFVAYPNNHIRGCGCPKCRMSKLEHILSKFLIDEHITFTYNKKFKWLKNEKPLSLDFYLPDYNIAIECQGEQHLIEERKFTNTSQIENDKIKNMLCKKNGIKLLYFGDTCIENINCNKNLYKKDNYFLKKEDLLSVIL